MVTQEEEIEENDEEDEEERKKIDEEEEERKRIEDEEERKKNEAEEERKRKRIEDEKERKRIQDDEERKKIEDDKKRIEDEKRRLEEEKKKVEEEKKRIEEEKENIKKEKVLNQEARSILFFFTYLFIQNLIFFFSFSFFQKGSLYDIKLQIPEFNNNFKAFDFQDNGQFKFDNTKLKDDLSFQSKNWNEIVYFSKKSDLEFRVEVDPDEIPTQIETKVDEMMAKFSKLKACTKFKTTRAGSIFLVEFNTKNNAEEVFEQLVRFVGSNA